MLLRFRVANYRSLRDEQELSFVATEFNEGTARELSVKPSGRVRVLPVIGIYGANASGKSNVLSALAHLGRLARGQLRLDTDTEQRLLGWDPHVLDPATRGEPTHYEVDFITEGVRYSYGLRFTDEVVAGEWLHAFPQGRRQVWFERDATAPEPLRFPDNHFGQAQSTLALLVRPDRPFVSLVTEVRHAKLEAIAAWFDGLKSLAPIARTIPVTAEYEPLFTGVHRERVLDMLQRADPGIETAEFVEVEPTQRELEYGLTRSRRELRLRHRGKAGGLSLPLRLESDGTRAWLRILRPLVPALETGGLLIVDELDSSLHPELVAETVRMFYDARLNRNGAQLLFSSHDVSLLSTAYGRPLLDRDQVWFTEKDEEGATELFPLTDLKPRKGENIERGYLSGRYGAVPGLSPGELARSLWPDEEGVQ